MAGTENTEKVTCSRCGRALRAAASAAAGIGPRCAAIEAATEGLSPKQVDKMTQVLVDNGVKATSRKGVYEVASQDGSVIRHACLDGTCDCEWGERRDADAKVCYHVAAARLTAKPLIRKPRPVLMPPALPASGAIWARLDSMGATTGALAPF